MLSLIEFVREGLSYILPFVFVLTIVVFFHEFGHYLVARLCGVRILAFSIGFGPELVSWSDRTGTRWRIGMVPLGGYVRFFGDEGAASTPDRRAGSTMSAADRRVSFHHKPVAQRAAIVVAGPLANFVLAILVFAAVFWISGRPTATAEVDSVQPGSAAAVAGFKPGDVIAAIDGKAIDSFGAMQEVVRGSAGRSLTFVVRRDGVERTLVATPRRQVVTDALGGKAEVGVLGIRRDTGAGNMKVVHYGPAAALAAGAGETWFVVSRTMQYVGQVATGRQSADQLSGPLRIAEVSGQAARLGFQVLMNLAAVLSVSIGLLNLFPIPLLDGGHLLYFGIEAVRGRPLSERAQEVGFRIGLVLVGALMLVATWNDIVHLATL
ncbi:MAG TPA: RIP metalloprotease RseP [Hyphomicrobiales bacterium]|nr:RIP metalloprotease RseP [Hyphomicrobiales bacterium]